MGIENNGNLNNNKDIQYNLNNAKEISNPEAKNLVEKNTQHVEIVRAVYGYAIPEDEFVEFEDEPVCNVYAAPIEDDPIVTEDEPVVLVYGTPFEKEPDDEPSNVKDDPDPTSEPTEIVVPTIATGESVHVLYGMQMDKPVKTEPITSDPTVLEPPKTEKSDKTDKTSKEENKYLKNETKNNFSAKIADIFKTLMSLFERLQNLLRNLFK